MVSPEESVSPVELRSQFIWLDSDGILHTQVKPHVEITLEGIHGGVGAGASAV